MRKREDITGKTFNQLTAVKYIGKTNNKAGQSLWLFRCRCGNEKILNSNAVKSNSTKACGCLVYNWSGLSNIDRAINRIISSYKDHAKKKNLPFELSVDVVYKLVTTSCSYCGKIPSNYLKRNKIEFKYNGIDRINSDLGYTVTNVVSCCSTCNKMKSNMTLDDFLTHIQNICRYRSIKLA